MSFHSPVYGRHAKGVEFHHPLMHPFDFHEAFVDQIDGFLGGVRFDFDRIVDIGIDAGEDCKLGHSEIMHASTSTPIECYLWWMLARPCSDESTSFVRQRRLEWRTLIEGFWSKNQLTSKGRNATEIAPVIGRDADMRAEATEFPLCVAG